MGSCYTPSFPKLSDLASKVRNIGRTMTREEHEDTGIKGAGQVEVANLGSGGTRETHVGAQLVGEQSHNTSTNSGPNATTGIPHVEDDGNSEPHLSNMKDDEGEGQLNIDSVTTTNASFGRETGLMWLYDWSLFELLVNDLLIQLMVSFWENRLFFFQFSSKDGLDAMLKNGHCEDGLSIIATKIEPGAFIRRHTGSYYPKRYWELLPKEILGAITQRDTGTITQRETGMCYGKMELSKVEGYGEVRVMTRGFGDLVAKLGDKVVMEVLVRCWSDGVVVVRSW
ncbi:hypothetical protein Tco_0091594 [Tanacetum coccineum]